MLIPGLDGGDHVGLGKQVPHKLVGRELHFVDELIMGLGSEPRDHTAPTGSLLVSVMYDMIHHQL
jgi:hypothetical protein